MFEIPQNLKINWTPLPTCGVNCVVGPVRFGPVYQGPVRHFAVSVSEFLCKPYLEWDRKILVTPKIRFETRFTKIFRSRAVDYRTEP